MKTKNKFFWLLFFIGIFLGVCISLAFQRFLPFVIQNNIYQCQAWFKSISVDISPGFFRWLLLCVGLFLFFWISSRLVFIFYQIRNLRKKLSKRASIRLELDSLLKKYGLEKKFFIIESERVFCFCFGFIYPKVYLSTQIMKLMGIHEIEAILLHEKHHLENKDSLLLFIAFLFELSFPFFPVISDLLVNYRIEREIRADQSAVRILGTDFQLVSVLRKMLLEPAYSFSGSAPLADDLLETRIKYLIGQKTFQQKLSRSNLFISLFSFIILFIVLFTPVTAIAKEHTSNQILFCSTTVRASLPFSWAIDK